MAVVRFAEKPVQISGRIDRSIIQQEAVWNPQILTAGAVVSVHDQESLGLQTCKVLVGVYDQLYADAFVFLDGVVIFDFSVDMGTSCGK